MAKNVTEPNATLPLLHEGATRPRPLFCVFLWAEVSQQTVQLTSSKQVQECSTNRPFAVGFERELLLNKISRLALNFELYNFTGIINALTATLHTN